MRSNGRFFEYISTGLLLLAWERPAGASITDQVLICNQGSPCTILNQSTTGLAFASSALFGGTATGSADAEGGILRAYSSYSGLVGAPAGQVNGNAQFFDQVTINSLGLLGTTGYLVLAFAVTGSTSGPANALLSPYVNCEDSGFAAVNCQTQTITGSGEYIFDPVPFTFGQLTGFDFNLDAVTYYGPGGATSAVSDFSDTALLNGIGVFENSNGTSPAPNPTFTSADGITYSANGIVPEPNSFPLLAAGLAFFLALIYRKRSPRHQAG
jgi:hypothetical protein